MAYFEFYKSKLSLEDKAIYEKILNNIKKGNFDFEMNVPFSSFYFEIFEYICLDHTELYYIDNKLELVGNMQNTKFKISSIYSKEYKKILTSEIANILKKQFELIKSLNEYDRILAVYQWFMKEISYDKNEKDSYSIDGVFLNKKAACQGISYAAKLICDYLKIKSIVVVGENIENVKHTRHAWNIVFIDNNPYQIDFTGALNQTYAYFCNTDSQVRKTHSFKENLYPICCYEKYNYFYFNNLLVNSEFELFEYIKSLKLKRRQAIEFKVKQNDKDYSKDILKILTSNMSFTIFPTQYKVEYLETHGVYKISRL